MDSVEKTDAMSVIYPNRLIGQQIRLLEVHPGSGADAIKTRLLPANLLTVPDFEAISYAWGDASAKCLISCDGVEIAITESLHGALLRMRRPQIPRLVWVDAICINRHDIDERNQQVALMHRIFSQASTVAVWLGWDGGENVHLAVKAINLIWERCLDYVAAQNLSLTNMTFKDMESVEIVKNASLDDAFDCETWLSISHFFARPWFERVWCAQEIILGQQGTILIDTCQVPWKYVGTAAAVLMAQTSQPTDYHTGRRPRDKADRCVFAAQLYLHQGRDTVLGNLETFCNRKATDPRDIVYGLLGLQDDRSAGRILEPDYNKITAEVYVDVVMVAVNDDNGLRILSNVQHEDSFRQLDDYPSWTPYWPRQRSVSFLDRGKWYAGGEQAIEVSFPSRWELLARGVVFEKIVFVSDIHPRSLDEYGSLHPFPELMLEMWRAYALLNLSDESLQSGFAKLCRTLTAGYTASGEAVHQLDENNRSIFYADYFAFIERILQYTGQKDQIFTPPHLATFDGSWKRYARGVRYACRSRRIFRTQGGSLGLGPACTGIGDWVCVLKGGKVPYVLRPAEASFNFLGECYIDDIMRGELFLGGSFHSKSTTLSLK